MTEHSDHRTYAELFIGGQWRKPANPQQLAVISPHTEEPIGHVQVAGPEDVDAAVAAGFVLTDLIEPEWPEGHEQIWGQWSPLRGRIFPGTAIFVAEKPPRVAPPPAGPSE